MAAFCYRPTAHFRGGRGRFGNGYSGRYRCTNASHCASVSSSSPIARTQAEQLEAFVRFILADKTLLAALRGRKWAKFAELYNGKAYAENLYDVKLERAFERYTRAAA